jgi:hypothetical protein
MRAMDLSRPLEFSLNIAVRRWLAASAEGKTIEEALSWQTSNCSDAASTFAMRSTKRSFWIKGAERIALI